jgi:hypothetical protein
MVGLFCEKGCYSIPSQAKPIFGSWIFRNNSKWLIKLHSRKNLVAIKMIIFCFGSAKCCGWLLVFIAMLFLEPDFICSICIYFLLLFVI